MWILAKSRLTIEGFKTSQHALTLPVVAICSIPKVVAHLMAGHPPH